MKGSDDGKDIDCPIEESRALDSRKWTAQEESRTPCGHGAQVIIEGRETQSDGGDKDKDNPTNKKQQPTTAQRPSLHHPVVFLCAGVKQVRRSLLTIYGPEFTKEEHGSEGLCSKISKKSSNGLHITVTSDQRPLYRVAKTWSRCVLQRRLNPYLNGSGVAVQLMPWKIPFL